MMGPMPSIMSLPVSSLFTQISTLFKWPSGGDLVTSVFGKENENEKDCDFGMEKVLTMRVLLLLVFHFMVLRKKWLCKLDGCLWRILMNDCTRTLEHIGPESI